MLRSSYHFFLIALLGCFIGYLLRAYLVQPAEIGAICTAENPPLWCEGRDFLIAWMISGMWGKLALGFVFISLFLKFSLAQFFVVLSLLLGGISLFLFGPLAGAFACVAGLVRGTTLTDNN